MLFYNGLIGVIITSILSIFFWQPLHSFSFIFFIFLGFFFCAGLFLQIKALSITPASVLAPYNYTIIVWAILFGLVVYIRSLFRTQFKGHCPPGPLIWSNCGGLTGKYYERT